MLYHADISCHFMLTTMPPFMLNSCVLIHAHFMLNTWFTFMQFHARKIHTLFILNSCTQVTWAFHGCGHPIFLGSFFLIYFHALSCQSFHANSCHAVTQRFMDFWAHPIFWAHLFMQFHALHENASAMFGIFSCYYSCHFMPLSCMAWKYFMPWWKCLGDVWNIFMLFDANTCHIHAIKHAKFMPFWHTPNF